MCFCSLSSVQIISRVVVFFYVLVCGVFATRFLVFLACVKCPVSFHVF